MRASSRAGGASWGTACESLLSSAARPSLVPAHGMPAQRRANRRRKKLTMIVGFAPGGGVDTLARVVAQEMDQGGYQVIIENRPGAGSNIAAKAVAGAAPDGATVLFTGNSYAINQTIFRNPGYETADLRPVAIAALDSQASPSAQAIRRARCRSSSTRPKPSRRASASAARRRASSPNTCSRSRRGPKPYRCRSRAARRRSTRCSAAMSTSSPRRSPRWCHRCSRARCGCLR